jgi:pilus assembly protein CpaE
VATKTSTFREASGADSFGELSIGAFVQQDADLATLKSFFESHDQSPERLWRGDIRTAVRMIGLTDFPDVLLVQEGEMGAAFLADSVAELVERGTAVVLIGSENSASAYRAALEIGARDYLSLPLEHDHLLRCLSLIRLQATGRRKRPCRVVACIGSAGGTGGTTIAANIAWMLATDGERDVALLDPDRFVSPLTFALDVEPTKELRQHFETEARRDTAQLDVVPSYLGSRLAVFAMDDEFETDSRAADPQRVMAGLRKSFEFVVVDLGLRDVRDNNPILAYVNEAVLVASPTFPSLRNTNKIVRFLQREYPAIALRILINQTKLEAECSSAEIKKCLEKTAAILLPFVPREMGEARRKAMPLAAAHPRHVWVRRIRKFLESDFGIRTTRRGLFSLFSRA